MVRKDRNRCIMLGILVAALYGFVLYSCGSYLKPIAFIGEGLVYLSIGLGVFVSIIAPTIYVWGVFQYGEFNIKKWEDDEDEPLYDPADRDPVDIDQDEDPSGLI